LNNLTKIRQQLYEYRRPGDRQTNRGKPYLTSLAAAVKMPFGCRRFRCVNCLFQSRQPLWKQDFVADLIHCVSKTSYLWLAI